MHNGKRIEGGEYFDDVLERGGVGGMGHAGILQSAGLDDYDNVAESIQQDGLAVKINCRRCGSSRGITLEWPELYQVGSNVPGTAPLLPKGWQFSRNNGTAVFMHPCPSCSNPNGLAIHLTPEEARRHVTSAVDAGLVSKPAVQAWGQAVARLRSQYRG